ncbi:MAG: SemiSWEET transporter [Leptospira sp.]|nr:SemiSWEET transporter [Leptospira sp.]
MNPEIIGYAAAIMTTIAFIPQLLRVVLTRETRDISRNMYIVFTLGVAFWLTFGIMKHELPIILSNSITLIFSTIILIYKLNEKK